MELFILLGEPDKMELRKHGPDPRAVYPTGSGARARLGRDGSRETTEKWQEGVKAGVDLRRDRGRGNCLLVSDSEVQINMFGSRLQVWDEGQGMGMGSFQRQMTGQRPDREWKYMVRRQFLFWLQDSERSVLRIFLVDAFPLVLLVICARWQEKDFRWTWREHTVTQIALVQPETQRDE